MKYNQIKLTSDKTVNAVLLQPELDPYAEKYSKDSITIVNELLDIAKKNAKGKVDFLLLLKQQFQVPGLSENGFAYSHVLNSIQDFTKQYPQSVFLTGASTYKVYSREEKASETAYLVGSVGVWVDSYNTALQIVPGQKIETYHKGKLVPGVESFPI